MSYDECQDESTGSGMMEGRSKRFVPSDRRKVLLGKAIELYGEIEKATKDSKVERECLLRMLETICNENR